ncbi:Hypothetical predicted protein [Olea europaea subsp. europaea]|uniref:Uncharacterized protein n=1 Tax=Olea europaea subsp. europaea TaxID=158383 RepID=A0A8S0SGK7_OLEEU|nr:Hypothetical predicted protein [Olea europaea subsp. europaea]
MKKRSPCPPLLESGSAPRQWASDERDSAQKRTRGLAEPEVRRASPLNSAG